MPRDERRLIRGRGGASCQWCALFLALKKPRTRREIRILVSAAGTFLILQFGWELAHASLYRFYTPLPRAVCLLLCAHADLVLGVVAYAGVAILFRRPAWLVRSGWHGPAFLWILSGIAVTVAIENRALRSGLWAYKEEMPKIAGIGLSPLLQWIVVPAAVIALTRRFARPRVGSPLDPSRVHRT